MKKKIISLLLAAVMVFSLLPVTALAEYVTVNNITIYENNSPREDKNLIYLPIGGKLRINPKVSWSKGQELATLDITTSNSQVASVQSVLENVPDMNSTEGPSVDITAVGEGTATVTLKIRGGKYGERGGDMHICHIAAVDSVTTSVAGEVKNINLKKGETTNIFVLNGLSADKDYYIQLASGSENYVTMTGASTSVNRLKANGGGILISIKGKEYGSATVNVRQNGGNNYKATINIGVAPEWTAYSVSGDTITATSSDLDYPNDTLTILPPANLAYDENAKPATIQDSKTKVGDLTASAITYKKLDGQDYVSFSGTPTDKGTYKAYVSVTTGETTYTAETAPFTISDILGDAEVTTAPTLVTGPLTYNGSLQALIATAGTATHGTVKYFIEESGATAPTADVGNWVADYSADTLKRADADDYDIYYYADGDSCYNDTEVTKLGSLTIAKHQVALVWPTNDFTYNGKNQAESLRPYFVDDLDNNKQVTVDDSDLSVKKDKPKLTLQGTSGPIFKDAGNYMAGVRSFGHPDPKYKNYTPTEETQSTSYTMKPAPVTVDAVPVADKVYNGKTDDASVTLANVTFTGKFGSDELSISGITGTYASAGVSDEQTVNLSGTWELGGAAAGNYVLAAEGQPTTAKGKITAFDLSTAAVTFDQESYTYTGSEVKPTVTVKDSDGNVIPSTEYEVIYEHNTDAALSTDGTHPTVKITFKGGNVTGSQDVPFTIAKSETQPGGVPSNYSVNASTTSTLNLSDLVGNLAGAKINSIAPKGTQTTHVITNTPGIAEGGQSISWTKRTTPSTTQNDVYTLTIESANYDDFTVDVTFTGKTAVTFPEAANFKFGGENLVYGTSYSETAPTLTVGGTLLNPQPTMTYTYYRNTGTAAAPVWTPLDPNVKPTDAGSYKVVIAVKDDNATYTGSKEYEFTIAKATQTAPAEDTGFSIDYKAETLTASGDTYEVSSTNSNTVTALEDDAVTPGGTYYVRLKGNDNYEPSPWATISVPARPSAVSGLTVHQESIMNKDDASLSGIGSTMEYCISEGNTEYGQWITGKDDFDKVSFLFHSDPAVSRYDVKVRYKATDSSFAGTETTYTFVPSETKLTVTFSGTGTTQQVAWNGTLTKPKTDPTKEGFSFGGWYMDEACTQAWNFDLDTVTGNMTLYPKWIENTVPNTVVTGMVKEGTEGTEPVPGARVELFLGTTKVATTTTNASGEYTFDYVENGMYNIVVTKNPDKPVAEQKKMTAMVTVDTTGTTYEVPAVVLPTSNVSSEVKVSFNAADTGSKMKAGATVAGGLDKIAAKQTPGDGEKVTIKLTVEPLDESLVEHATDIKNAAGSGKTVEFLNLTLTKHINDAFAGDDIGGSNQQLLTIIFPFDFTDVDANSVTALRYHDRAEAMTRNPADNAEGFTVNEQAGTITLKAFRFSEYAIAYSEKSSGGGGGSGSSSYAVTASSTKNGTISVDKKNASAGQTVTITVTPDKGYTLETLTVLDKNGKEIEVKDLGNGKFSFKMPGGKVSIGATFMEDNAMLNFFVDVKATNYYYDAVLWAAENGITKGTDAVHFSPKAPVTRAQVVTFLWRAAGKPVVNYAMSFADVPSGAYYAEAVRWAVANGITKGTTATTFDPNGVCTRGHIVTFLYRYAKASPVSIENPFTDVAPGRFYYKAVLWADANDITHGRTKTTFAPKDPCTRAQVVTFIYRYMVK